MFRENQELYRLSGTVDDIIYHDTHDKEYTEAEQHAPPVVENEITGRNDDNIAIHHHPSQRYILVLVDNPGDDIRSAGTTVVTEYDTDTESNPVPAPGAGVDYRSRLSIPSGTARAERSA